MHRENHLYGHARILADHVGQTRLRPITGYLQHGWQPGTGVVPDCARQPWPKLIWSRRNLEACEREGVRAPRPIGSPFLYLPVEEDPGPSRGPKSLLAFPFHGWPGAGVTDLAELYAAYARSLAALRGGEFEDVTVCMYWLEHEKPELRAVFEREGLRIVTAGDGRAEPDFLPRLRRLIREHAHVTANRVATATFYALASGRPFFRHGPTMWLAGHAPTRAAEIEERERREFPTLGRETYDGRVATEIADRELGAEYVRDPEGLRVALDWTSRGLGADAIRAARVGAFRLARGIWRLIRP